MPTPERHRVVLDTNTLFRGLANGECASGRILAACESRKAILLLSRAVIAEYRAILTDERIAGPHGITPEAVDLVLRRLQYFGERIGQTRTHFRFDRDPGDEKFIELAIAGEATRIVTCDKDLLSLASGHKDAAKRFRQRLPGVQVLDPLAFVRELETAT